MENKTKTVKKTVTKKSNPTNTKSTTAKKPVVKKNTTTAKKPTVKKTINSAGKKLAIKKSTTVSKTTTPKKPVVKKSNSTTTKKTIASIKKEPIKNKSFFIEEGDEIKNNPLYKITKMMEGTGTKVNENIPALEVINYTKRFGSFFAAKNVDFKVNNGVIHGFIGPNGSGKTTTIKTIIGGYNATKGKLLINGQKSGTKKANSLIGYIPERASFPNHLNTIDYLTSMAQLSGIKFSEAKHRAREILVALELSKFSKKKPIKFSSGMQKKILLAQSLLTNPSILILDEPAANLDPTARKDLFNQLILLRNKGKTIFISSHILSELERIVDEVTFIDRGAIIFSGKVEELKQEKENMFIKTDNNLALISYLKEKNYEISGDERTEIIIKNLFRKEIDKLIDVIIKKLKISIISFRTNDLQTYYENLLEESRKRRGEQ